MKTKLRSALLAAAVGLLTVAAPVVVAPSASAHGWITSPPSRQDHCAKGTTSGRWFDITAATTAGISTGSRPMCRTRSRSIGAT